ncbi:hypothetical protein Kpol_363p2 [Vanderwaltozyma polyspora DSM 70294]|uniref:37S ribosomal protein PET123, mitochondrial n=1 Tax=Vanderwaltozyma polyspora (strain ATCC 22028 / DSM 70294 / BCRC 21397 / CBS 2163 / NBRC 10782 / NRRL Y-8283 / UCD 57-17) TaxID=436907 RepID=A7TS85_VANPO|nr:uncharacterized protein Kpol_363p2 [Vanderwaltozyma polyspora DSM 70294]EDO14862.1 hypothetical protein Kpol_363p2 [Vanderwaltozyma polyspora DSM 70294]
MGKNIAKYGYKSGVLPVTRNILKKPTVNQTTLVEKANAPKKLGVNGVGYAEGVQHPRGSTRVQRPMEFIHVEKLIKKTVSKPKVEHDVSTPQRLAKHEKSELRRRYLAESFRKEEQRLISLEKLVKAKELALKEEHIRELKELEKSKTSDLTIPSLNRILNEPMMRERTEEEKEILAMKREYNNNLMEFKAKERRLQNLINLYHISNNFIVTEEKLLKEIEIAFSYEGSDRLRNSLGADFNKVRIRNENSIGDSLFGSVGGGSHVGLDTVKDYLSGELNEFSKQIDEKFIQDTEQKKIDVNTIL